MIVTHFTPVRHLARRWMPVAALACAGLAAAQGAPGMRSAEGLGLPPLPGGGQASLRREAPQAQRAPASLDALMDWERQDMGVRPEPHLHTGEMHGPTPNQIPGAQLITTKGLLPLLREQNVPVRLFDVLGAQVGLPGAIPAVWASRPGSFDDATQARLAQTLRSATGGRRDVALVFYCGGPQCWMSYNAALRAARLGYPNVMWYRGGLEAWHHAGQVVVDAGRAEGVASR
jgi:PQQ-dependent catabolism-associated CXXCW motif protein